VARVSFGTDGGKYLLCLGGFALLDVFLFGRNLEVFVLNVEAETVVDAQYWLATLRAWRFWR
jgi:hypothetical protein